MVIGGKPFSLTDFIRTDKGIIFSVRIHTSIGHVVMKGWRYHVKNKRLYPPGTWVGFKFYPTIDLHPHCRQAIRNKFMDNFEQIGEYLDSR